jgi:hypothetical protein
LSIVAIRAGAGNLEWPIECPAASTLVRGRDQSALAKFRLE